MKTNEDERKLHIEADYKPLWFSVTVTRKSEREFDRLITVNQEAMNNNILDWSKYSKENYTTFDIHFASPYALYQFGYQWAMKQAEIIYTKK